MIIPLEDAPSDFFTIINFIYNTDIIDENTQKRSASCVSQMIKQTKPKIYQVKNPVKLCHD